jgi:RNA polymerase sigma-70 factor (ECF subfamily)
MTSLEVSPVEWNEPQSIERAQAGDRAAFALLVDRYWNQVLRWLFGLTHNQHLAEDLTQEAFLKAWRRLGTFERGANFRTWVFRIARNCLTDWQRDPRSRVAQSVPESVPARDPDPVDAILSVEGQALFRQACARLPDSYREAFLLWTQKSLSYAEIAQVLSVTEETARWRVFKARLFLVNELCGYLNRKSP